MMHVWKALVVLAAAVVSIACAGIDTVATDNPTTPPPPVISDDAPYEIAVAFSNNSGVPARLLISDGLVDPGAPVGFASPDVVAPYDEVNVRLVVPGSKPWAFWVLDAYDIHRPVFTSEKMGTCRGTRLPIVIEVSLAGGRIAPPNPLC
jgi:hypothetical protein